MAESLIIKKESTETSLDVRIIEPPDAAIHERLERQRLNIDDAETYVACSCREYTIGVSILHIWNLNNFLLA